MTEGGPQAPWWSLTQALVWIVTRSESKVLRATNVRTFASVLRMTGVKSLSDSDEPPMAVALAPDELVRAWQARRITLYGRELGKGPSRSIPRGANLCLRDYRGEICLGDRTLYFDTRPYWSSLAVQASDCKHHWLPPVIQATRSVRKLATARPSHAEVLALIEEKQKALRGERKRAGRDVLLRAAMNHFGMSRKVALEIWNSAPRDRKGGRPKKRQNV